MSRQIAGLLLLVLSALTANGQICTNLGQNPETAFPVCGSSVFTQSNVAICGSRDVPAPCSTTGASFQDKNPYWYKFTCFTSGTLAFLITPTNLNDDYDWQLFDVTNKNPADVYTDPSLFLACNWSGESGLTGASSAGSSLIECAGRGVKKFSTAPALQQGHNYILLISHFTNSQSGYTLAFNGGTASITDTTKPKLKSATASCDGKRVSIKLNKKMKCSSLAANGSDFSLSTTAAAINGATSFDCSNSFDMDSLVLSLDKPLPPGNYSVSTKKGSDANTLLDYCDAEIAVGEVASFTILPAQPTVLETILPVGCKSQQLELTFNNPVICSSIAADGSDFIITGLPGININSAVVSCSNKVAKSVTLKLAAPVYSAGNYTIAIKRGSDGNTIISECNLETPVGNSLTFSTKDTVSAKFTYIIKSNCKSDSILFSHPGGNSINSWKWTFDASSTSLQQNPIFVTRTAGSHTARLVVTNGVCTDSSVATYDLAGKIKADFVASPPSLCPEDIAVFKDSSLGNPVAWSWDFGNGVTSSLQNPPPQNYPPTLADRAYNPRLIVRNNLNCTDTVTKPIKVLYNCFIGVPSAFTPNDDRLNDYLYPINAYKAKNLRFRVYNRFGQLLFSTTDFTVKWDGTFKGIKQSTGVYVWMLDYTHTDTNKQYSLKGTTVLIR